MPFYFCRREQPALLHVCRESEREREREREMGRPQKHGPIKPRYSFAAANTRQRLAGRTHSVHSAHTTHKRTGRSSRQSIMGCLRAGYFMYAVYTENTITDYGKLSAQPVLEASYLRSSDLSAAVSDFPMPAFLAASSSSSSSYTPSTPTLMIPESKSSGGNHTGG